MVDAAVLEKLEAGFQKLEASDSKSLLKKYLTRELFDSLKTKKTSFGSTLLDVIQSGKQKNHALGNTPTFRLFPHENLYMNRFRTTKKLKLSLIGSFCF